MSQNRKLVIFEAVSASALAAAFLVTGILRPGIARSAVGLTCLAVSWVVSLFGLWLWSRKPKKEREELDRRYTRWIFPPSFLVKVIPIGLPLSLLGLIISTF